MFVNTIHETYTPLLYTVGHVEKKTFAVVKSVEYTHETQR